MECRVIFDYTSVDQDELDIVEGDTIRDVEPVYPGWYRGTLTDKVGIFPDDVVKINASKVSAEDLKNIEFIAKQEYEAQTVKQLTVPKGAIIRNVSQAFGRWNIGTVDAISGVFPANVIKIHDAQNMETLLRKIEFVACNSFTAKHSDHLTITPGDVITNVEFVGDGWHRGILAEKCGMVPNACLVINGNKISAELLSNLEFLVTHDFSAPGREDMLHLRKGDIISNATKLAHDSLYKGVLKGKVGIFHERTVMLHNPRDDDLAQLEFIVKTVYDANGPNQLTVDKGDIIRNVKLVDDNWYNGTRTQKSGLFRDNFVTISKTSFSEPWFQDIELVADFHYNSITKDELTLMKGDIIVNASYVMEGWFRGTLKEKSGGFPDHIVKLNSTNIPPAMLSEYEFVVTSDYKAQKSDQLNLRNGDVIRNAERIMEGWYKGTLVGRTGLFPDNYVEIVTSRKNPKVKIPDTNVVQKPDFKPNIIQICPTDVVKKPVPKKRNIIQICPTSVYEKPVLKPNIMQICPPMLLRSPNDETENFQ